MSEKPMNKADSEEMVSRFLSDVDKWRESVRSHDYIISGELVLKLQDWFVSRGQHIESSQLVHELLNLPRLEPKP